ncbi:hypothetical protein HJ590_13150 [Naumannella sp. ID2617S]|nr:hypothetical protein [Naumannella sp. ID2617S]
MSDFRTWDSFVDEARIEPYKLPISDDEVLTIECPSGAALVHIGQGMRNGDLEVILASLCGDSWDRINTLMATAPHGVLPNLVEAMMDHFNLYEPVTLVGPSGGKVTRRKPREIRDLINRGYRPMGEAAASRG